MLDAEIYMYGCINIFSSSVGVNIKNKIELDYLILLDMGKTILLIMIVIGGRALRCGKTQVKHDAKAFAHFLFETKLYDLG